MKKSIGIVLVMVLLLTSAADARVIYEISQPSRNSYVVHLTSSDQTEEKIQLTGYKKIDKNTIEISYDTGKHATDYRKITITADMMNLELEESYIYPNVILKGEKSVVSDIADLESIQNLYNRGIVNGYPDGTFRPNNKITREEFCALFFTMLDLPQRQYLVEPQSPFVDVENQRWSKEYIMRLEEKGIVQGRDEKTFAPQDNITLGEVATIIDRTYNFNAYNPTPEYMHQKTPHWSNEHITALLDANIIRVDDEFYKNYTQDKRLTREEMCIILNRVVNRFKEMR